MVWFEVAVVVVVFATVVVAVAVVAPEVDSGSVG